MITTIKISRLCPAILGIALVLAGACPDVAALEIYYLRHGETGGNVKKAWENIPKEQWPDYVGNSAVFTPAGREQVARVADKLEPYHFDFIAVSPIWRARQTILPYLQKKQRTAEVWPALSEFGTKALKEALKTKSGDDTPGADLWTGGPAIKIPEEEAAYFKMEDGLKQPKIAGELPQAAIDVRAMAAHMIATLRARYGGTDKTILLVGHGNNGRLLLELLTEGEVPAATTLKNTGLWRVKEQPDGRFKLSLLNDEPL